MVGSWLVVSGLCVVAVILLAGQALMLIGGPLNTRWSNTLMRYHVLAQGMTLLVICLIGGFSTIL